MGGRIGGDIDIPRTPMCHLEHKWKEISKDTIADYLLYLSRSFSSPLHDLVFFHVFD